MPDAPLSRSKQLLFVTIMLFVIVFAGVSFYFATVIARGSYAYYQFKLTDHAWVGRAWRSDAELGYAHVPGFRGTQTLAADLKAPLWIDADGFRIPANGSSATSDTRPLVLALGDSNTFGLGCRAQDSYPFLVADALGGEAINAAVSGYGLLPMLVQARRLIPAHKPDFVLLGYSPGLERRSRIGISETRLAAIPVPYFFETQEGSLGIQNPLSKPVVFDLGLEKYWTSEAGVGDLVSFLVRGGIPALVHRDYVRVRLWLARAIGRAEPPMSDGALMSKLVVEEMAGLARQNGGRLLVVSLGRDADVEDRHTMFRDLPDVSIVEARWRLETSAPEQTKQSFSRSYHFWSGSPLRVVDMHYNPTAQRIIADAVLDSIGGDRPAPSSTRWGPPRRESGIRQ